MARKCSFRNALSNPSVIREVADELLRRMRSPDLTVQLRAAKSLIVDSKGIKTMLMRCG